MSINFKWPYSILLSIIDWIGWFISNYLIKILKIKYLVMSNEQYKLQNVYHYLKETPLMDCTLRLKLFI